MSTTCHILVTRIYCRNSLIPDGRGSQRLFVLQRVRLAHGQTGSDISLSSCHCQLKNRWNRSTGFPRKVTVGTYKKSSDIPKDMAEGSLWNHAIRLSRCFAGPVFHLQPLYGSPKVIGCVVDLHLILTGAVWSATLSATFATRLLAFRELKAWPSI